MSRKPRPRSDPFEHRIELALCPGSFIRGGARYSFVDSLEEVAANIGKLTKGEPARASALYETFLAGCYEKAEELDDSGGSFGQFVHELFCGWIRARQAAGADPDETATMLLAWMDEDPYALSYQLEKDAARAFDKAGRVAFVRQIRARFDAAAEAKPIPDGSYRDRPEYIRRRWGEVLRTLYLARKSVAAYVSLVEQIGLTVQDCLAIATLLNARGKRAEALAWVERGIDFDQKSPHGSLVDHDLAALKRKLLAKLGRRNEALDAGWADYRKHPSRYTYDELMKFVPKRERAKWHEQAIDAAVGANLRCHLELLLHTKELSRLVNLIDRSKDSALEGLSHYFTEPIAKKLEKTHPGLAGRLWRAQGMRIVNAGKSKYYDAALSNFENARRCFERARLASEWKKTVKLVRADHHRKIGFMAGFERLGAGVGPSDEPSFLERAKARWGRTRPRVKG